MTTPEGSDRAPLADDAAAQTGVEVIRSEEQLRVGTTWQAVERVRIARRIVTEVRQIEVAVRREELVVQRESMADPRDGFVPEGPDPQTGEDIVMVLSEEVPLITMGTRPYERVGVRVQRVTEQREVTEPVRREEVVVDNDSS
jgi:uncharacterized protein (TIGR02271 family)